MFNNRTRAWRRHQNARFAQKRSKAVGCGDGPKGKYVKTRPFPVYRPMWAQHLPKKWKHLAGRSSKVRRASHLGTAYPKKYREEYQYSVCMQPESMA